MTESAESAADNLDEDDTNEVLLDELKRQKTIVKIQLTKLYSRLIFLLKKEKITLTNNTYTTYSTLQYTTYQL